MLDCGGDGPVVVATTFPPICGPGQPLLLLPMQKSYSAHLLSVGAGPKETVSGSQAIMGSEVRKPPLAPWAPLLVTPELSP